MSAPRSLIIIIGIVAFSCSSPLDKPYNKESIEDDMIAIKKSVSEEDLATLAGYITLSSLGGKEILGKTYRDILNDAKEVQRELKKQEEERKRLAEKARIEAIERSKRLGEVLLVSLFDKGYYELNYQDYLTYKFVFENKSNKDIRAFTGTYVITDLFDKEIKKITLTYDEGIIARTQKSWNAQTEYNQFDDSDVTLKNKDIDNLKTTWIPSKIMFTDGSHLD